MGMVSERKILITKFYTQCLDLQNRRWKLITLLHTEAKKLPEMTKLDFEKRLEMLMVPIDEAIKESNACVETEFSGGAKEIIDKYKDSVNRVEEYIGHVEAVLADVVKST